MELVSYKLEQKNGFINPRIFRLLSNQPVEAVVEKEGIMIENNLFVGCSLPVGTIVLVKASRNIECFEKTAWEIFQANKMEEYRKSEEEKKKTEHMKRVRRMEEANEFNSKILLPFKWDAARWDVLSGLSANSWGDGYKKNTVHHILVLEGFKNGRLIRKAGDHLCSGGNTGKGWSGTNNEPARAYVDRDVTYMPKITCKSCLRVAERILENKLD